MIRRGLILFLILALPAQAEIYRWVDAEGRVHFSDRRAPGAERLEVQTGVADRPPQVLGPSSPDEPYPGPYAQVSLLTPVGDQTLNDPAEGVMVSLQLDPPLIEGHQLRLLVDDRVMVLKSDQTQFRLQGLEAGRHRLQIQIWGAGDRIVAQSAPRVFELRLPRAPGEMP